MSGECLDCGEHTLECKCTKWNDIPYEMRLCITRHVFVAITEVLDYSRSFRALIYNLLGFKPEDYEPLYRAGGMQITNAICDLKTFEELFANPKKWISMETAEKCENCNIEGDMRFIFHSVQCDECWKELTQKRNDHEKERQSPIDPRNPPC